MRTTISRIEKKAEMYERIRRHGRALLVIFPNATDKDPVSLCKKLRRLEAKAAALALQNCNVGVPEDEYWIRKEAILTKVQILLGYATSDVPVFLNGDPRGYALKIDDEWMRKTSARLHNDMGGYGIIAPDLESA